jgi:hypothetical protein
MILNQLSLPNVPLILLMNSTQPLKNNLLFEHQFFEAGLGPPKRKQIEVNVDLGCFVDGRTGWGVVA